MTTYKSTIIPLSTIKQPDQRSTGCKLQWRQGQLWVQQQPMQLQKPALAALETEQALVECLKHSYVKSIRIDASLGEEQLKLWVDACEKANKALFLRLPTTIKRHSWRSLTSRLLLLLERMIAALLLLVLSPVIVILFCLLSMRSPQPILQGQWHVTQRGRLFRLFKFQTTVNTIPKLENKLLHEPKLDQRQDSKNINLDYWIRKYKLDRLPQLFNVLRGEMRLFKPYILTLEEAVKLSLEERQIKILGIKQV